MKTLIIKMKKNKPSKEKIKIAAKIIAQGGIVAFPTETVYGLGANALNEKAVAKIFKAKGRPADNPIIVHVSSIEEAEKLASEINPTAKKLVKKFWPGPLTIIVKSSGILPRNVTAGLKTVGLRMPSNKIALELIRESNCPIAAPSANISGKPSGTNGSHAIKDFNGKIDAIIDAGTTDIGIESTVVDVTGKTPRILRPGKITLEQITKVCGFAIANTENSKNKKPKAPGMKYRHYAPKANVKILEPETKNLKEMIKEIEKKAGGKTAIITCNKKLAKRLKKKYKCVYAGRNVRDIAKIMFNEFRKLDEQNYKTIIVQGFEEKGFGTAVMNRLKKASSK
jgi:L-threonylcarbamoyladenylate synthase